MFKYTIFFKIVKFGGGVIYIEVETVGFALKYNFSQRRSDAEVLTWTSIVEILERLFNNLEVRLLDPEDGLQGKPGVNACQNVVEHNGGGGMHSFVYFFDTEGF